MIGDEEKLGNHLRTIGHEFGTVTKRPRRIGWLDVVVMRYTQLINGFTSINLTKLDCLSDLNEIKLCTGYSYNGKILKDHPSNLEILEKCTPVYETMKGWKKDISKCRTMSSLPIEAQNYIKRIEQLAEVHIEWVGVGVDRVDMVYNPKK
jgi:adenylosuccinate synthase